MRSIHTSASAPFTVLALALLARGAGAEPAVQGPSPAEARRVDPPAVPPRPVVETARLEAHIRALPTARAGFDDPAHLDGLIRTQEILRALIKDLGFTPTEQRVRWSLRDRPATQREWVNLFFEIPGRETPKQIVLVSGHFDAVPHAPGADDDGTGVAAVLELARVLKDQPLKRTVRFALYNLEEVGLVGSTQHSAAWLDARDQHGEALTCMLSLEMLGFYSDQPGSQRNPFAQLRTLRVPDRADFIGIGALLSARPWVRVLEREMKDAEPLVNVFVFDYLPLPAPDLLRSDNGPWMIAGEQAAMVTGTANFRNPNYHGTTDTIDTLDLVRFTRTVNALAGGIQALAGTAGQPDAPPADGANVQDLTPPRAPARP